MSMNSHSSRSDTRTTVAVDDHSIVVEHPSDIRTRDGPLWLFIHGIAASCGFWAPLMPTTFHSSAAWLSASLPVHAPSRPSASFAPGDVAPELFVKAYQAVLDYFATSHPAPARQVVVVGHSTGGYAAFCLAIADPDRVSAIVSAGGFSDGRWEGLEGRMQLWARRERLGAAGPALMKIMSKVTTRSTVLQRRAGAAFAADKRAFLNDRPTAAAMRALQRDAQGQDLNALVAFFAGIRDADIRDRMGEIGCPVLLIDGSEDTVIPARHTYDMEAALPDATLKLFPDAGHMIMCERREVFWTSVLDWVGDMLGTGKSAGALA